MMRTFHSIALAALTTLLGFILTLGVHDLAWAAGEPQVFDSPEAAAKALVATTAANDEDGLIKIFGTAQRDIVGTSDKTQDAARRASFAKAAKAQLTLFPDTPEKVTLIVGYAAWPFSIPLVKTASGWQFDAAAGREELLNRRIGRNELTTIEALRAYVIAQRQYASQPRDGTGVRRYAKKLRSTPGTRDGLYWPADASKGEEQSPIGPMLVDAAARTPGTPYNGYRFRTLTRQGPKAPGGAYSYVINGNMVAGYALIAYPADYGITGVMSFLVNHYGDVYEKDLGPQTAQIAAKVKAYDPDASWTLVPDR